MSAAPEQPVSCGECGGTGWKRGFEVDGVMGGMRPVDVRCRHYPLLHLTGPANTDCPS